MITKRIDTVTEAVTLAGAKLFGIAADGETRLFDANDIQGGYKGPAAADTDPGTPVISEKWDATPGVTYPHFGGIAIPVMVGELYVVGPQLVWTGSAWDWTKSLMAQPDIELEGYVTTEEFAPVVDAMPEDYNIPSAEITTTVNPFSAIADNATLPNELTIVNTDPAQGKAPHGGNAITFRTKLNAAEVGRKVTFFVFRFIDPTNIKCIWASAVLPAEAAGLFELTGQTVPVQEGDMAGVFVDYVSSANGMRLRNSGGADISQNFILVGTAALNSTYAYAVATKPFWYNVGMDVYKNPANLIPYGWKNKANGPLVLTSANKIPDEYVVTPAIVENSKGPTPPPVSQIFINDPSTFATSGPFAGNSFVFVPVRASYGEITANGKVKKFSVKLINAEVGRKTTFMILRGGSYTCVYKSALIATEAAGINEWTPPADVLVQAGDRIAAAVTCINVANNMAIYFTGGPNTEQTVYSATIPALGANLASPATYTQFRMAIGALIDYASLYLANMSWGNVANGFVGLDSNLNIPNIIGRAADMQFKAQKIVWLSTSIGADNTGGVASYPSLVGEMLGADMLNQAVPSSRLMYETLGPSNLALTGSVDELNAITPGYGIFSYQQLVLGKLPKLVVIDHGINDISDIPSKIGTIDSFDRDTYMGAMNFLLDKIYLDNSNNVRFLFVTPPNRYDAGGGGGTIAKIDSLINTTYLLAKKYNAPVCNLAELCQINERTKGIWTIDSLHPTAAWRNFAAPILYNAIKAIR